MADANAWAGMGTAIEAGDRAADAVQRISEKPTSITLKRGTNTLAVQSVRVEYSNQQSNSEAKGGAGVSATQRVIVFGVRGHATVADTDIQRDDRFALGGIQFRVVSVIPQTGEVQAMCEAQS